MSGEGGSIKKLKKKEEDNRKTIEKILAVSGKRGITVTEIVNAYKEKQKKDISWLTVKKHLSELASIKRVDVERHGNSEVYYLNGEGKYKKKISLSNNHTLWLDVFRSSWGEPYVRVKETKKSGDDWKKEGAIIISGKVMGEFLDSLKELGKQMKDY